METIYQDGGYRIVERPDLDHEMENLKGDCYSLDANPEIDGETLRLQELNFEQKVEIEGVFGYTLETWNGEIDRGWEQIDACWGFVGTNQTENHYIVAEFKTAIALSIKQSQ